MENKLYHTPPPHRPLSSPSCRPPCRSQALLGNASLRSSASRRSGIASPTGTIHPRKNTATESPYPTLSFPISAWECVPAKLCFASPPIVIPEFSFRPPLTPALPHCAGGMKISGIPQRQRGRNPTGWTPRPPSRGDSRITTEGTEREAPLGNDRKSNPLPPNRKASQPKPTSTASSECSAIPPNRKASQQCRSSRSVAPDPRRSAIPPNRKASQPTLRKNVESLLIASAKNAIMRSTTSGFRRHGRSVFNRKGISPRSLKFGRPLKERRPCAGRIPTRGLGPLSATGQGLWNYAPPFGGGASLAGSASSPRRLSRKLRMKASKPCPSCERASAVSFCRAGGKL